MACGIQRLLSTETVSYRSGSHVENIEYSTLGISYLSYAAVLLNETAGNL